jgi:hypothetical protein
MSLLDKASLVQIPSGYKEDKLYSVVPAPTYGSELAVNGDFDTDSDWTKGGGWSIVNGEAVHTGSGAYIEQGSLVQGANYRVVIVVTQASGSGFPQIYMGGLTTAMTSPNTYTFDITAQSGDKIKLRGLNDCKIDSISVKEILVSDGDFDFSRSSTGTRVNSDGYIEEVPWNYNTNSEDLNSNTKLSIVVTSNDIISPRGTQDADKVETTSNTSYRLLKTNSISFVSGTDYTFSFYAKKGTTDFIQLITTNTLFGATSEWANFDLNNGVVSLDNYGGASIEDVGDGWYRCIMTSTCVTSGTNSWFVSIITSGTSTRAEATAGVIVNVYVWGLQVVKGSVPKPYIKTTDRLDVPRLDYSDGSCASLLLEPQSTNLVTQSETFSNWGTEGGKQVVTQGVLISPDGTLNGNKLETYNSTSSNRRKLWIAKTVTVGASYTFSVYIKQVSGQINSGFLHITRGANDTFDVSQAYTATDQWQRVSVTTNSAVSSQIRFLITGDANSQIYIWGGQVEQQSYPTSYIPTSGSTTTRTADSFQNVNSSNWSSVEGTLNLNLRAFDGDNTYRQFSLYGSGNDSLVISYTNTTNQLTAIMKVGGSTIFYMVTTLTDASQLNKIAFAYSSGRAKLFINGIQKGTSSASYSTSEGLWTKFRSNIGANYNYYFGRLDGLYISKTALTDEELTALTTI